MLSRSARVSARVMVPMMEPQVRYRLITYCHFVVHHLQHGFLGLVGEDAVVEHEVHVYDHVVLGDVLLCGYPVHLLQQVDSTAACNDRHEKPEPWWGNLIELAPPQHYQPLELLDDDDA